MCSSDLVSVAMHEGSDTGALVGFAAGLGFDFFVESPLGLWALSFAVAGWAVGPIQGGFFRVPRVVPFLLGAFAGVVAGSCYVVLGVITGVDGLVAWQTLGILGRTILFDIALAPLVFFIVSRLLAERTVAATYRLGPQ